jgi:hypothetical protein
MLMLTESAAHGHVLDTQAAHVLKLKVGEVEVLVGQVRAVRDIRDWDAALAEMHARGSAVEAANALPFEKSEVLRHLWETAAWRERAWSEADNFVRPSRVSIDNCSWGDIATEFGRSLFDCVGHFLCH